MAEIGGDTTDSPEDTQQRALDTAYVKAMRRFLETKYLGTVHLGPGQNEPMREYIGWLMEPLEGLVYKKSLMTRLRLKQLGGPTGVAKTQVARDFMEMAKRYGMLDNNRGHYQQGDANKTLSLGRIDELQKLETELLRGSPTNGYSDVKARHLQTYALLFFDESSHNAIPPEDLTADFAIKLRALKARFDANKDAQAKRLPKPVPPTPGSPDFNTLESKYHEDLIAYEVQETLAMKPDDTTFEEAVHRLKLKYDRDKSDRAALDATMHKIWQATSNGYWTESEEKGRTQEHADAIKDAHQAIVDWEASHKQKPLLGNAEQQSDKDKLVTKFKKLYSEITPLMVQIEAEAVERGNLEADLNRVERKLLDFQNIPLNAIEAWLQKSNMHTEAGRVATGSGVPAFFDLMLEQIRADQSVIRPDQLGFEPGAPQKAPSALSVKLRQHILDALTAQQKTTEERKDRKVNAIKRLREEVESRRNTTIAFGKTQKEQGKPDEMQLLRDYERLQEAYHSKIMAAADLPSAREAIDSFIDALRPDSLEKSYPKYYDRLIHLHNDPAKYLKSLRESRDFKIKLTEILYMDPDVARNLIKKAVTEVGFHSRAYYLGNINVVMSFNDRNVEQQVDRRIKQIRQQHNRGPTIDEYAHIYKELVPEDWADKFMATYFRKLFTKMIATKAAEPGAADHGTEEDNSNPIAERRRVQGGEGATFIYPMNSEEMVTSVATTVVHEFERWKDSMRAKGLNVDGIELYIHENVAPQFVRDDVHVEFGPNAILTPVRQSIGKLLVILQDQILKRHAANPEESFKMNLALIDEANRGELHSLTLRYLDPAFEQLSPILSEVPKLGKNSKIAVVNHVAKPSQAMRDKGYKLDPVDTHVDPKKPMPLTVAEQQAEEKRVEDEKQRLEAERQKQIAEQERIDTENREKAEAELKAETDRAERLASAKERRKLETLIKSKPSRAQLEEFYLEIPTQGKRDAMRDYLYGLAKARRGGANMGHLFLWLDIDFGNGVDVDKWVHANRENFKKYASNSVNSLLPNVIVDEEIRESLRTYFRPGGFSRFIRRSMCAVQLGRLVHRQVPPEFRGDVPKDRIFGGP